MTKSKDIVVYIHGLLGNAAEAQNFYYIKDYDIVGLDYEDGAPWIVGKRIKKTFRKLIKNYKDVVVIANSIGAFYTYAYLSSFNIKQAFFISPLASMKSIVLWRMDKEGVSEDQLMEKKYIKLENGHEFDWHFYKKYVIDNFIDPWNVPTEILYSENDEVIKKEDVISFVENHSSTRLTIKQDSMHYLHTKEEMKYIENWILERLK